MLSKTQLIEKLIASSDGLSKKNVKDLLEGLADIAHKELKKSGAFRRPWPREVRRGQEAGDQGAEGHQSLHEGADGVQGQAGAQGDQGPAGQGRQGRAPLVRAGTGRVALHAGGVVPLACGNTTATALLGDGAAPVGEVGRMIADAGFQRVRLLTHRTGEDDDPRGDRPIASTTYATSCRRSDAPATRHLARVSPLVRAGPSVARHRRQSQLDSCHSHR